MTQQLADGGVILRETVPSSDVVRSRFADVDGLKALAIASVVVYQTIRFVGLPGGVPTPLVQLFGDASQGFTLFLLLSAFSLAYPILAAVRTDGAAYLDVGRYATKRIVRVVPAIVAVLTAAFALHPLAAHFKLTAIADAIPAFSRDAFGNDGFTAVRLIVRGYLLLPFALVLWLRAPRVTIATAVVAAVVDVLTPAHAVVLSAIVPLVLGIAAADLRVRHDRLQRFGIPLAAVAAVLAFVCGPRLETLAGGIAAPDALRVDPLWSIAFFGLLAAIGHSARLERFAGFAPLRLAGTAAYALSLVAMPVAAFAARELPASLSLPAQLAATAGAVVVAGFALWQTVDRWFSDERIRRSAASPPGGLLDRLLRLVRLDRVVFATRPATPPPVAEPPDLHVVPAAPEFYAPPPRPVPVDLAVLSTRTGSADDLAAEILQTKARLTERSASFFAANAPAEPEPVAPDVDPYARPGVYRRAPNARAALPAARHFPQPIAPPAAVAAPTPTIPVAVYPVADLPVADAPVAAIAVAQPEPEPVRSEPEPAVAAVVETPLAESRVAEPVAASVETPAPDANGIAGPDPGAPAADAPEPPADPGVRRGKASLLHRVFKHVRSSEAYPGAAAEPVAEPVNVEPAALEPPAVLAAEPIEPVAPPISATVEPAPNVEAHVVPDVAPTAPAAAPVPVPRTAIRMRIGPARDTARPEIGNG